MASQTVFLVSIEVNYLTVTGDCSCLVIVVVVVVVVVVDVVVIIIVIINDGKDNVPVNGIHANR